MLFSMLFGILGVGIIISQTTPDQASLYLRILFFCAFFLFLIGFFSLFLFWIRYRFTSARTNTDLAQVAYKQGLIISTIIFSIILIIHFLN